MTKETIEMTNKLIIPNGGQDDKSQEIFESLEGISEEEIMEAGEELEKAQKESYEQQEGNEHHEPKEQEESTAESTVFENIGVIGGDYVEYDQSKSLIKRRGNCYKVDDFQSARVLMDDLFKTGDTTGAIQILGKLGL